MWAGTGDSIDIEKPAWEYVSPMWHTKAEEMEYYVTKLNSLQAVQWLQVRFKGRRDWNSGAKQNKNGAGLEYLGKATRSTTLG